MRRRRVGELIVAAQVSQACNSIMKEEVLNVLADKLAADAGAASQARLQLPLAGLESATLAHLLRRTLRRVASQRHHRTASRHAAQVTAAEDKLAQASRARATADKAHKCGKRAQGRGRRR